MLVSSQHRDSAGAIKLCNSNFVSNGKIDQRTTPWHKGNWIRSSLPGALAIHNSILAMLLTNCKAYFGFMKPLGGGDTARRWLPWHQPTAFNQNSMCRRTKVDYTKQVPIPQGAPCCACYLWICDSNSPFHVVLVFQRASIPNYMEERNSRLKGFWFDLKFIGSFFSWCYVSFFSLNSF